MLTVIDLVALVLLIPAGFALQRVVIRRFVFHYDRWVARRRWEATLFALQEMNLAIQDLGSEFRRQTEAAQKAIKAFATFATLLQVPEDEVRAQLKILTKAVD